jgi:hypothetical protein
LSGRSTVPKVSVLWEGHIIRAGARVVDAPSTVTLAAVVIPCHDGMSDVMGKK